MTKHYVDNAKMLQAIKDYKEHIAKNRSEGIEDPRIPEYIGECILKIANNLSHKANFINYSYREDMVLDGIENCMQCINSFDPSKSSNPFSYFTQVIYFAFLRRIAKEKKQSYIKSKLIRDMPFESFETQGHDDEDFQNAFLSFIQSNSTFDDSFIKKKEEKKKKKAAPPNPLEDFIEPEK
jgi:hypothetical protein